MVQTQTPEFINNVKALVTIAQIYKLPSIITTSAADGPNGPIMPVVARASRRDDRASARRDQRVGQR